MVGTEFTIKAIREEVRHRYHLSGKNQQTVAEELGVTQSTVSDFLTGRIPNPRISTVLKYCNYFNIHIYFNTKVK